MNSLIKKINKVLKGKNWAITDPNGVTHYIYPCSGCGGVMYGLYHNSDNPHINLEFKSLKDITLATKMYTHVTELNLTNTQFVGLLEQCNEYNESHDLAVSN